MTNFVDASYPLAQMFLFGSSFGTAIDIEVYVSLNISNNALSGSPYLDAGDKLILTAWTGIADTNWFRCYKATADTFSPAMFRAKCNNKNSSITIYNVGGNIFGGYTSLPWQSTGYSRNDPTAFVFTLKNPSSTPRTRAFLRDPANAVYDNANYFPSFGQNGADILADNPTISTVGLGTSFEFAVYDPNAMLAGSRDFFISDVEVFALPRSEPLPTPSLLSESQQATIASWVGYNATNWTMCYKSRMHGFSAYMFHEKCDNRGKTFIVGKSTNGGIVGGFTSRGFVPGVMGTFTSDTYAFVFSLANILNITKAYFPILNWRILNSVYQDASKFVQFGDNDLVIGDYPNNRNTLSTLSNAFDTSIPQVAYSDRFLVGSSGMNLNILEIYVTQNVGSLTLLNSTITSNITALNMVVSQSGVALNQWYLCFRMPIDGTLPSTFRAKCAQKGSSLLLAKSIGPGYIFGGYTSVGWNAVSSASYNGYLTDNLAYIFSIKNYYGLPPQIATLVQPTSAILDYYTDFPRFGAGGDLHFSATYTWVYPKSYDFREINSKYFIDGGTSPMYSLVEIEAYYLPPYPEAQGTLLTPSMKLSLQRWIGLNTYLWQPCYKATIHGHRAPQFHSLCDLQGPTVTVVNTTLGTIFGGYLSISWMAQASYQYDSSAFLYTFYPYAQQSPVRYHHDTKNYNSVYNTINHGPTFGSGFDMFISDNAGFNYASYNIPQVTYTTITPGLPTYGLTGGSYYFTPVEVEVYKLGGVPCAASCFNIPFSNPLVCNAHGLCTPPDNCSCDAGWTGQGCQYAICYGISAESSQVCSMRNGTCAMPGICTCNSGFTGARCQTPICSGKLANDSTVCSSRGTCVHANLCQCPIGFTGPECQYFVCHGYSSADPAVCSSRGICSSTNQCTCSGNYTGAQCEMTLCNGVASTNASVCSGNGQCVSLNSCTCNRGYMGTFCEIPICYGVMGTAAGVCTGGRGACTKKDTCTCQAGYYDFKCQTTSCHGTFSNSSMQCSERGQCTSYNKCDCDYGYVGATCNETACFAISYANASVCSGHGQCYGIDLCNCSNGFTGTMCEANSCFGIAASSALACGGSSKGQCVGPNSCQCTAQYNGAACSIPICHGKNASDPLVCSALGNCSSPNNCTCKLGYFGSECQYYNCFGIRNDNSSVCAKNGQCSIPNRCNCNNGYVGAGCSVPVCFGILGNASHVCGGNGAICIRPNVCTCANGNAGANCDIPVCYSYIANETAVCSSNGSCLSKDNCSCNVGYTGNNCQIPICYSILATNSSVCSSNGSCTSRNNCQCNLGYLGNECNTWDCHGVNARSNQSCSSHGNCVAPSTCSCNSGWIGQACNVALCNGIQSENVNVCSRNGNCIAPGTCACNAGYIGSSCQVPVCFGVPANHSTTCSGNGSCVAPSLCQCNMGYGGPQCNTHKCFDILANDANVCSRNGTCQSINFCSCNPGYSGLQSNIPACYSLNATNPQVCSSRGECIARDFCKCNLGYFGQACELYSCGSYLYNSSQVCSHGNGSCIAPSLCQCNVGYAGQACQYPICYNTLSNDSAVCSSRGKCIASNLCACDDGYFGSRCEIASCFGKLATDPTVCSHKNGSCTTKNFCTCNANYTGNLCQIPICFDKQAGNACSGHGFCIKNNTCQCQIGYASAECETFTCNSIAANDARVCSARGVCLASDRCKCWDGYAGFNCQFFACANMSQIDPLVCSARGSCNGPNTCNCNPQFVGTNCEHIAANYTDHTCFNYAASDARVCSGRGNCTNKDFCTCSLGYAGVKCESYSCFGKSHLDMRVCSGRGNCSASNLCTCNSNYYGAQCNNFSCFANASSLINCGFGRCIDSNNCACDASYTGPRCNIPVCFAKRADDPQVCSQSGFCIAPNRCSCWNGTLGSNCERTMCFGKLKTDKTVCSGKGQCTSANSCSCSAGYFGPQCDIPMCYSKLKSDPTVCNGEGSCLAYNSCACNNTRKHLDCSTCLPSYTGSNCEQPTCDNARTCNNHGVCDVTFNCTCFANSVQGYWDSTYCTTCKPNYVGAQCNIFCNATQQCSAHGTCASDGACSCYASAELGYWMYDNCSACATGYYGTKCATSVSNFTFSDDADRILGIFSFSDRYGRRSIDCDLVFDSAAKLFGSNARCWWPNPNNNIFEVIFGERPSLLPFAELDMNMMPFSTTKLYRKVIAQPPQSYVTPKAILQAPPLLGVCDDVALDGAASNSPDRRLLKYSWTAVSGYRLSLLNAFLQRQTSPYIVIPSDYIEPLFEYQISLVVTSFLNISSNPAPIFFSKLASGVPVVSLDGPVTQYVNQTQQNFVVTAQLRTQHCRTTSVRDVTANWYQTHGIPVSYSQRNTELVIHQFVVSPVEYTLKFRFFAFQTEQVSLSSFVDVNIIVYPTPLVASIAGSTIRTIQVAETLVLDASASYDPSFYNATENLDWTCIEERTSGFCSFNFSVSGKTLIVPANSAAVGSYIFEIIYTKDARVASKSVTIVYTSATTMAVSIALSHSPVHSNLNRVTARSILSFANNQPPPRKVLYSWSLKESTSQVQELAMQVALSSLNEPVFVFSPTTLMPGHSYLVSLSANYTTEQMQLVQSTSTVMFDIAEPPFVGVFLISPVAGIAIDTPFQLNCQQFRTTNPPLQYAFSYLDSIGMRVPLSFYSQANVLVTTLPAGKVSNNFTMTIFVTVKDSIGAITETSTNILVTPPDYMRNNTYMASINRLAAGIVNSTSLSDREGSAIVSRATMLLDLINDDTSNSVSSGSAYADKISTMTCPTYQQASCAANCSNEGYCSNGVCICNAGRKGKECQYRDEELLAKESVRFGLLVGILNSIKTQLVNNAYDTAATQQLAMLCNKLTKMYEEVSPNAQTVVLEFLNQLIEKSFVTNVIGDMLMQTIGNIAASMQHRLDTDASRLNVTKELNIASDGLLQRLALTKFTGEKATVLHSITMNSVLYKAFRENLASQSIALCGSEQSNNLVVVLPSFDSIQVPDEVNLKFCAFKKNPYYWSESSKNMSSDVVRVELLSSTGASLQVKELQDHIALTLPIQDHSLFSRDFGTHQWTCKYWNVTLQEWKSDGCKLGKVSAVDKAVTCLCNHTTDFSVFLEKRIIYATNTTNGTSMLELLLSKNFTCLITIVLLPTVFAILLALSSILNIIVAKCVARNQFSTLSECQSQDTIGSTISQRLIAAYSLIGFLIPSAAKCATTKPSISRVEKAVLLYVGSIVMLAIHAVVDFSRAVCTWNSFGVLECQQAMQMSGWVAQSIAVAVVGSMVYRCIGLFLANTAPRTIARIQSELSQKSNYKKYHHSASAQFEVEVPSERPRTPKIVPIIQDEPQASPMFRSSLSKTPDTPDTDKALLTSSQNKSICCSTMFTTCGKQWNDATVAFANTPVGHRICLCLTVLAVATFAYFVLGLGFAVCMHYVIPANYFWTMFATMALVVLSWTTYVQFMYFAQRQQTATKSRLDWIFIIFAVVMLSGSIVVAVGSGVTAIVLGGTISIYTGLVAIGCIAIGFSSLTYLILTILFTCKAKKSTENAANTGYLFAAWVALPIYMLCVAIALTCNFVIIYYGLNFDMSRATTWLIASLVSLAMEQTIVGTLVAAFLLLVHPIMKQFISDITK